MVNCKCMLDEENILRRVSEGDRGAFKYIFYEYFAKMKSFLMSILHDSVVCEDIAQDIFVKVWTMRYLLPEIRSLDSYLFRMAKNAALNYLRYARREIVGNDIEIGDDSLLEHAFDAKEKLRAVGFIISGMPRKRRKVFIMSRIFDIPNDMIAERLNISKKTVENHINLANKTLKECLADN